MSDALWARPPGAVASTPAASHRRAELRLIPCAGLPVLVPSDTSFYICRNRRREVSAR